MHMAMLAERYGRAPVMPNTRTAREVTREAWQDAGRWFTSQAETHKRSLRISVTTDLEPYGDTHAMFADIDDGSFMVSSSACDHPVWTPSQNMAFRIWHDIDGHYVTRTSFDRHGEYAAWAHTQHMVPGFVRPVLACESLLQLAYACVTGDFGEQRVMIP